MHSDVSRARGEAGYVAFVPTRVLELRLCFADDHGDLLSEINKKGRFRMPTPKVLGNVSGGEITDGPEGDLNTSRRSKSVKVLSIIFQW